MTQSQRIPTGQNTVSDEELITGEAVTLDVRATGFALRALGTIVDMLLAGALLIVLIMISSSAAVAGFIDDALMQAMIIGSLVVALVIFPVTIETLTRGRSVGKIIIGVRIVRDDGGSIHFRHALIRGLVGVLELWMTSGGIAAVVGLLNPKAKRLGDMMAGTYSQYERVPNPYRRPVLELPWQLQDWARTADVAKIPDRLMRRVASFLRQTHSLTPQARERIASALAEEVSPYVFPLPQVHPEHLLIGISVLRRDRELTSLHLADARLQRLEPILRAHPHQFPKR